MLRGVIQSCGKLYRPSRRGWVCFAANSDRIVEGRARDGPFERRNRPNLGFSAPYAQKTPRLYLPRPEPRGIRS